MLTWQFSLQNSFGLGIKTFMKLCVSPLLFPTCLSHPLALSDPDFQASVGGVRRFTKPPESLERSLELSRHRGRKRTQKRPNYKNLGEEEEEDRAGGGGGGGGGVGGEEGWEDDGGREREKGKGTEGGGGGGGSSKGSRASGETAEGECVCHWTQEYRPVCECVFTAIDQTQSPMMHSAATTAAALLSKLTTERL